MIRYAIFALGCIIFCSCQSVGRDVPPPISTVQTEPVFNPNTIPSIDTTTKAVIQKDTVEKLLANDITHDVIETVLDIIEHSVEKGDFDNANTRFRYFIERMEVEGKSTKKFSKRIERIEVKLAVAEIRQSEHIDLPNDNRKGRKGAVTRLAIENSTSYTLTVYYSGTDSKIVIVPPFKTETFNLPSGKYEVAASVAAPHVSACYGSKNYEGGSYSTKYYIQTSRF